jgi:hypothetical protein
VARPRQLLVDAGIAVVVFGLSLSLLAAGGTVGESEADARGLDGLAVALAALASLPLAGRRRAPLAVFALT